MRRKMKNGVDNRVVWKNVAVVGCFVCVGLVSEMKKLKNNARSEGPPQQNSGVNNNNSGPGTSIHEQTRAQQPASNWQLQRQHRYAASFLGLELLQGQAVKKRQAAKPKKAGRGKKGQTKISELFPCRKISFLFIIMSPRNETRNKVLLKQQFQFGWDTTIPIRTWTGSVGAVMHVFYIMSGSAECWSGSGGPSSEVKKVKL